MSSARVLIASVLLVWQISVASGATWQVQPAVVTIADGQLQGVVSGAIERFLGIPYAAPPVGELRFAPPQDVAPWDGVLNATSLPNRCPVTAGLGAARSETEDCLYLNLVRPAGISADSRLPVFVFIHGGGLTSGSANQYDLGAMVETNGFINVSIN